MRLNRAMLYVKDLHRMSAFYGEVLGLKPVEETRMDNWVEFDAGNAGFALHAIPPSDCRSDRNIFTPPAAGEKPRETDF